MAVLDFLVKQLTEKGWLAISSVYFDNAYSINVFNTRGYVAYSKSAQTFFTAGCIDSTDSESVDNKFVVHDTRHFGLQQVITCVGEEHMQHFDIANYSQYRFTWDKQTVLPYPKVPTKAEILALTPNPETGLYPGLPTVELMDGTEISVISLYEKFFDYFGNGDPFSGARVDNWIQFYKNQDKFREMLSSCYGITDAI